ncbi:MAG: hypothetical protein MRK01_05165 [Candidatus Scalindua sp.]|nr:hypothetical protein [Candidatus Scalindua sp.]
MGLITAEIESANPGDRQTRPIKVKSLVDTGSLHLCIPEHVAIQLELEELYKRKVTTADAIGNHVSNSRTAPEYPTITNYSMYYGYVS